MNKFPFYLLAFTVLLSSSSLSSAQNRGNTLRMEFEEGFLTLRADQTSLPTVLDQLAEETELVIRYPAGLEKEITITLTGVPLRRALKRILKGQNYALVYSGSGGEAVLSEIQVFPEPALRPLRRSSGPRGRYTGRSASVRRYERRLESLRDQLSKLNGESPRSKMIASQIRLTERILQRLEKRSPR